MKRQMTFAEAVTLYTAVAIAPSPTMDPLLALTSMIGVDDCEPCALSAAAPPDPAPAPVTPSEGQESAPPNDRWEGCLGVEGEMTGDGRLIEPNALRWDTPMLLRYVSSDVGAHDGAVVVGTIESVTRLADGRLWGTGTFDMESENGREAQRQVAKKLTTGVSMDLDDVSFEIRVAAELLEMELLPPVPEDMDPAAAAEVEMDVDADGRVKVMEMGTNDEVRVTTDGRMRAATLVAIPAFASAFIGLAGEVMVPEADSTNEDFNWVDDAGGLPTYIKEIADHLVAGGMTESHAIASAVNTVKRWARGGSVRADGGPNVTPATAAKAAVALAEWEAKKAAANASAAATSQLAAIADPSPEVECLYPGCSTTASEVVEVPDVGQVPYCAEHAAVDMDAPIPAEEQPPALVASSAPVAPPAAWFANPNLTEPTPIVVTAEGRIYGHLAAWNVCHASHTQPGQCVLAPHSRTNYANYRTGSVLTAEGTLVPTGRITLDTIHAGERLSQAAAVWHYEDTGTAVADVAAGEDVHGIWVAGALRPNVSAAKVRELRASPLSGDWRRSGGNLELVAALAVNVPGFAIPRPHGLVAGGAVQSLVASGMLAPKRVLPPGTPGALSNDDLRYLKRLADRERAAELAASPQAALHRRVHASDLKMRVRVATLRSHTPKG